MQNYTVLGNICKDNELRYSSSNKAMLRNTIAVRRTFKNKEDKYESDFIPFIAMGKTAEIINSYASKGSKILLNGEMRSGSYENQEGKKIFTLEMFVNNVELVGSSQSGAQSGSQKKEEPKKVHTVSPYEEFGNSINSDEIDLTNSLPF